MSAPGLYNLGQTKTMSGKNGSKGEMMSEEYVALSSTDECVKLFGKKVSMSCMGTPVHSCNKKSEDDDTKGERVSSAMATHEIEFGEAEAEEGGVEERCRREGEDLLCKGTQRGVLDEELQTGAMQLDNPSAEEFLSMIWEDKYSDDGEPVFDVVEWYGELSNGR